MSSSTNFLVIFNISFGNFTLFCNDFCDSYVILSSYVLPQNRDPTSVVASCFEPTIRLVILSRAFLQVFPSLLNFPEEEKTHKDTMQKDHRWQCYDGGTKCCFSVLHLFSNKIDSFWGRPRMVFVRWGKNPVLRGEKGSKGDQVWTPNWVWWARGKGKVMECERLVDG